MSCRPRGLASCRVEQISLPGAPRPASPRRKGSELPPSHCSRAEVLREGTAFLLPLTQQQSGDPIQGDPGSLRVALQSGLDEEPRVARSISSVAEENRASLWPQGCCPISGERVQSSSSTLINKAPFPAPHFPEEKITQAQGLIRWFQM